jgi:hypothetical protein
MITRNRDDPPPAHARWRYRSRAAAARAASPMVAFVVGMGPKRVPASRPRIRVSARPRAVVQLGMTRPFGAAGGRIGFMSRWCRVTGAIGTDRR